MAELQSSSGSGSGEEDEEAMIVSENHYDPRRWPNSKKFGALFLVSLPTFLTPLSNT